MYKNIKTGLLMAAVTILTILIVLDVPYRISEWEKAHDYPYGRLCDLYNSCK